MSAATDTAPQADAAGRPATVLAYQLLFWIPTAALAAGVFGAALGAIVSWLTGGSMTPINVMAYFAQPALAAFTVVLGIALYFHFAAWLTAGARRSDIARAITTVTLVDTLAFVAVVALADAVTGAGTGVDTLARLALAVVAMHVGAVIVVAISAVFEGRRTWVLLPLTAPLIPYFAVLTEGDVGGPLLTLVHVLWLGPALLIAPFLLRRMPAPRRLT